MCLRRAPEKYIAGAALDRAGLDNVGSSTSHNPIGLHGLIRGQFSRYSNGPHGLDGESSNPSKECFSLPQHPYPLWDPPRILFDGFQGLFLGDEAELNNGEAASPCSYAIRDKFTLTVHYVSVGQLTPCA
jgi:hypothetical protein